jgi:hypothetical protein
VAFCTETIIEECRTLRRGRRNKGERLRERKDEEIEGRGGYAYTYVPASEGEGEFVNAGRPSKQASRVRSS